MLKVTIDDDEVENVVRWNVDGNTLILNMADGSIRGVSGWLEFEVVNVDDQLGLQL